MFSCSVIIKLVTYRPTKIGFKYVVYSKCKLQHSLNKATVALNQYKFVHEPENCSRKLEQSIIIPCTTLSQIYIKGYIVNEGL